MTLYRLLRNTHLMLGAFSAAFLAMYGLSAVQMGHNTWFSLTPSVTVSDLSLPSGLGAREAARALMAQTPVRGDLAQVQARGQTLQFRIARPGTVDDVTYELASGKAMVRESRAGVLGMLNRLHHAAGVRHEYGALNVWGFFIGAVSLALFVIGLTGVYLWFKLHAERTVGVILLVLCLAYTLPLIVSVRMAW